VSAFVDTLRSIGLDVETAIALEQELDQLPARTKEVFMLRAQGYTQEEVGERLGIKQPTVWYHVWKCEHFRDLFSIKVPKKRTYIGEGVVTSDYT